MGNVMITQYNMKDGHNYNETYTDTNKQIK